MENVTNMEMFKDIKGYPDYQVSNFGRVWNKKTQKYMKPSPKSNGYYQINMIALNGKRKKEYIHRLVALAFVENPNNYPEVDHINRNKSDNRASNLRWANRSMNARNRGKTISQYSKDGILIKTYNCIADALDEVNGTFSGIYSYFYGKAKYYKGYTWTLN